MIKWTIVDLAKSPKTLSRKKFYSRIENFNKFFWEYPSQYERKSLTKVFTIIFQHYDQNETYECYAGYYTLNIVALKNNNQHYKIIRLKRLATEDRLIGMNVAPLLLIHALKVAYKISKHCPGIIAIEVFTFYEDIRGFFERFGFKFLGRDKSKMYLSIATVYKLFQSTTSTSMDK